MKCVSCGYNLGIEDVKCPYCGALNEHARKHNQDMEKYREEFEETKEEVIRNSRRFSAYSVKITVIAILIALIAISILIIANGDEIKYRMVQNSVDKSKEVHIEAIQEYEKNHDPDGLLEYYDINKLSYANYKVFAKYESAISVTRYYDHIREYTMRTIDSENGNTYYTKEKCIEDIAKYIGYINENTKRNDYNAEQFEGVQGEYITYIKQLIQDMLQVYFNLTDEEASGIWEMSNARLNIMLEEGLER